MNWWRAIKRPEDHVLLPDAHHNPESDAIVQKQDPLLANQRNLESRAVQKMLSRSQGEPLAESERSGLEAAFGQDLSEVRIHHDEEAGALAADAGASAFTASRDIYFAPGAYSSATLAHEVSHVLQQAQAASVSPGEDSFLEHQADFNASAVMSGHTAQVHGVASAPAMQRLAAPGGSSLKLLPSDSLVLDSFEIDKFALSGSQKQKLDVFAGRLKGTLASAPDSVVTIVGFADAPGTVFHNLGLGQLRAESVRDYLVAKGIAESQLHATSLGEGSPAVMSKGYEAKNRRVEINVVERSFFQPPQIATSPAPVPAAPVAAPKGIDLKYQPQSHDASPGDDFQQRLRQIDEAVRQAQAAEKANAGVSAADLAGRVLRKAAKNIGLPQWAQDLAESVGKDLPSKGAQAAIDQAAGGRNLDANTQNALKALADALLRMKVK